MMEEQDKSLEISEESQQVSPLVKNAPGSGVESPAEPSVEKLDAPQTTPTAPMHWCVLRVASNKEEVVREALIRKMAVEGLTDVVSRILVPMERRPAPRGKVGKKKYVDRKMYPGYVFVEMTLTENGSIDENVWFAIKETNGVGDFIGSVGKPSPMAPADVTKMLSQIEQAQEGAPVVLEFAKGDMVKIKEGAFENFEGEIDEVLPDKGLVRVVVTIFGRATPVELEYWQVEKV
jgi:transcription termination/antitermination protein NusG